MQEKNFEDESTERHTFDGKVGDLYCTSCWESLLVKNQRLEGTWYDTPQIGQVYAGASNLSKTSASPAASDCTNKSVADRCDSTRMQAAENTEEVITGAAG